MAVPRPRVPLFAEPVSGVDAGVRQGEGLPPPALSVPVLGEVSGSYAIAMPDDTMEPAVGMGWLVYVKPGPPRFGGIVAIRIKEPVWGAVIMLRRLQSMSDDAIVVGTLNPPVERTISMEAILSVHPVYAVSLDPALYGPDGDELTIKEEWLARFEEGHDPIG